MYEQNSFERFPIQHKTPWPKWLGIRLQSSDGCCWRSNPTGGNFLVNLFFRNCFCLADVLSAFLSDMLIVKNPNVPTTSIHSEVALSSWIHFGINHLLIGSKEMIRIVSFDKSLFTPNSYDCKVKTANLWRPSPLVFSMTLIIWSKGRLCLLEQTFRPEGRWTYTHKAKKKGYRAI